MRKILIVDDAQNIRITLKRCLESGDYKLEMAMNGEEALKKIMDIDFDLVFLDLQLPVMTGMEVLKKVRQKDNKVNIVIITAYGTVENAVEAMKLGAIDFVQKPFSPGEIRKIVASVWAREEMAEENLRSFEDYLEFSKKKILEQDYKKAGDTLKKALAINSKDPEAHYYSGILSENMGDFEKAKESYRTALKLSPSYKQAEENLNKLLDMEKSIGIDEE